MKTAILCGGKGTRLGAVGEATPKPLLQVGSRPLLWHIMSIYAAQGHSEFLLCVGHLKEKFAEYLAEGGLDGSQAELVPTGDDTPTGGRIKRLAPLLDGQEFLATYGDGVANVDLARLLAFHRSHGRIATITVVRPVGNFGIVHVADDDRVSSFEEKPLMRDWVNGGFFVFRPEIFDYLVDDSILEREPFERLAAEGQLMAYRHDGFWSCMDTYKDHLALNEIWSNGDAPWKVWE